VLRHRAGAVASAALPLPLFSHTPWRLIVAATLGSLTLGALAQPASAPAAAASAADADALPVVRIKAAADKETATSAVPGYAARRAGAATKTDTPLNEIPQSISVITADQVRDQASQTLQDALRYSAGVRHEMYGLDNRGDWFTLRGGSEGSVLLDGLRLPLAGWYGVVRNEPYAFERIEVLRGPASVIAGQNGPGGVVNLVSKRPQAEALREVGVQVGNHGHKQLQADLTGPLTEDGTLLWRVVALAKDSGTQVDHAFDERALLAPSLTWRPNARTSIDLHAQYQRDESGNVNAFFPYQGTVLPSPNGPIPMETFIGEPDWDTYGGERLRAGWRVAHELHRDWTLRHHLRHDRVEGSMRTMYADWSEGFFDAAGNPDPNGTWLQRLWYFNDDKLRTTHADLLVEGRVATGPVRHTLLAGIDTMQATAEQWTWSGTATPLDVYRPVYGTFALPALDPAEPDRTRVRRTGVLLQDQMKWGDRWVVVAGVRRDQSRTNDRKDAATSGNLGAVFLAGGGWSPYAGYSESFEPVAGSDAGGQPFKPTRGRQVEAGVKWQPAGRRIVASAAAYRLVEQNRLAPDPNDPNEQVQRGEVTVQGFEVEASARLRAWDLVASYTYADAAVSDTTADDAHRIGQQLSGIPRHSASAWAVHRLGGWGLPGLRAGLGMRYAGTTGDGIGVQSVPAVTLVDAMVGYDTGPWRLALNVNNLADKRYVATCLDRGDCWFGVRRKVVLSATYAW
jgi:iron complex outermembrane receptor protein